MKSNYKDFLNIYYYYYLQYFYKAMFFLVLVCYIYIKGFQRRLFSNQARLIKDALSGQIRIPSQIQQIGSPRI
jgi:hypothetical protein